MIDKRLNKKVSLNSNLTVMGLPLEGDNKYSGESLISESRNSSPMQIRNSDDQSDFKGLTRELSQCQ